MHFPSPTQKTNTALANMRRPVGASSPVSFLFWKQKFYVAYSPIVAVVFLFLFFPIHLKITTQPIPATLLERAFWFTEKFEVKTCTKMHRANQLDNNKADIHDPKAQIAFAYTG